MSIWLVGPSYEHGQVWLKGSKEIIILSGLDLNGGSIDGHASFLTKNK